MGLAGTKNKRKLAHDPNNTRWTRDETTFGQRILRSQGWEPGKVLGAQDSGLEQLHSAASSAPIKVVLKDDTMGLGAKPRQKQGDECTGLDGFADLLGRLNGKSDDTIKKEQAARADLKTNLFVDRRYGPMRFVSGGLLVGDSMQQLVSTDVNSIKPKDESSDKDVKIKVEEDDEERPKKDKKDRKSKKRKATEEAGAAAEDAQESAETSKEKKRKRKAESDADAEDGSSRKDKKKKSKRSKSSSAEDTIMAEATATEETDAKPEKSRKKKRSETENGEAAPATDESDEKRRKREKKEKKERKEEKRRRKAAAAGAGSDDDSDSAAAAAAEGSGTSTPAESGTSTPQAGAAMSGRQRARMRYVASKRMAMADMSAMNQIFMVKPV